MKRPTQIRLLPTERTRSKSGPSKGGTTRAQRLTPEQRRASAQDAARARWGKARQLAISAGDEIGPEAELPDEESTSGPLPEAQHRGVLRVIEGIEIPCYVLSNGQRVIGRTSATEMLTGIKGGGAFEAYLSVANFRAFIDVEQIRNRMVTFRLPEVEGLERRVMGMPADLWIEVCQGFVAALEASTRSDSGTKLTSRQLDMALRASMFLSACAKVGLDSLIDEATGYQYERAQDALEVKLKAYLADEMRKWERTFPDELWIEFGRLTGWSHSVIHRPKYWGHLVMELIYEYLDQDVADWLKENAPKPQKGQNYHQWLSGQYGLRKLTEHIWKVIGIAKTCENITELKRKMGELHGRMPVQYTMYLPMPNQDA